MLFRSLDGHSREKRPLGIHSLPTVQWKEIGRSATRTRLGEEVSIPGRIQARGRKENEYKKW